MKQWKFAALAFGLAVLCAWPAGARARPEYATRIRIGDPYRGAALDFHEEPAVDLIPSTMVYYVRNRECDLYRYGRFWYFLDDGVWYRSRTWQGPFLHLQASSVPRSVRAVPLNYRRHWLGPLPLEPVRADGMRKPPSAR